MARLQSFDPNHVRCIHPEFGAHFDSVVARSGKTPSEIAAAAGISHTIVRGYMRGFWKPSPGVQKDLERYLGTSLDVPKAALKPPALVAQTLVSMGLEGADHILVSFRIPLSHACAFFSAVIGSSKA